MHAAVQLWRGEVHNRQNTGYAAHILLTVGEVPDGHAAVAVLQPIWM